MKSGESQEATRWAVLCPTHGQVYLTRAEYNLQMMAADSSWQCPRIRKEVNERYHFICGATSEFDNHSPQARFDGGV